MKEASAFVVLYSNACIKVRLCISVYVRACVHACVCVLHIV